jgi:hypothetical protein
MLCDVVEASGKHMPRWTNPSVKAFAEGSDPVSRILSEARGRVFSAMEQGWSGPPFDPLKLADMLKVQVVPLEEVEDARLIHHGGHPRIEFNPHRSVERVRFSIAHELAHLLFPDAADRVRHRSHSENARPDDWQIELLCNLAAAEILMPSGSFPDLAEDDDLDINRLMYLRSEFLVSAESALLRAVRLTATPASVFAAARDAHDKGYRIDYLVGSRAWTPGGSLKALSEAPALRECTAVGFTARTDIEIDGLPARVECVGVPPYPRTRYPRVVGLLRPLSAVPAAPSINYLHGDAAEPRGEGVRVIAHIVNDTTVNWGGSGFAPHLRSRYLGLQDDFRDWAQARGALSLGVTHLQEVEPDLFVCSMVAQHQYGKKAGSIPLRYGALERCLDDLGSHALRVGASVHMPMIGAGQAGGNWAVIEEMVERQLLGREVDTTVYLLPGATPPHDAPTQLGLQI